MAKRKIPIFIGFDDAGDAVIMISESGDAWMSALSALVAFAQGKPWGEIPAMKRMSAATVERLANIIKRRVNRTLIKKEQAPIEGDARAFSLEVEDRDSGATLHVKADDGSVTNFVLDNFGGALKDWDHKGSTKH